MIAACATVKSWPAPGTMIGRGFDVSVAVPFGRPLSEGLRKAALRCAEACPTGALALRTARSFVAFGVGGP